MFNFASTKIYKKIKDEGCVIFYEVNIDEKSICEVENNALIRLQSTVILPGFRTGKAPLNMIKQQFPEMVRNKVLDMALKRAVDEIMRNEKIHPVVPPIAGEINYEPSKKLSFKMRLEVNPRFDPQKYNGIQLIKKVHTVSEEDIDKHLKLVREYNAYLKPVEGDTAVAKNHYITVDYHVYENGEKIKNGDYIGEVIDLSSPHTIAGMDKAILGAKKGEEKEFETEFDGKKMKFRMKINEIKEKVVPEIDENFLASYGAKDIAELRIKVRKILELQEAENTEKDLIKQIEDSLIRDNTIPLPPTVVNREINGLFEALKKRSDIKNPEMLNIEDYVDTIRPIAERNLRMTYLLHNIAEKENIRASEDDLAMELDKVIRTLKSEDEVKDATEIFKNKKDFISALIVENKTFEFIKSKAEVKEQVV